MARRELKGEDHMRRFMGESQGHEAITGDHVAPSNRPDGDAPKPPKGDIREGK
jgi:hypothetical protein